MATAPVCTDVIFEPEVELRPATLEFVYMPSLDGLRALAVLVVMAYHDYVPFFRGGQIGVDIFFVLSGFLITSLLLREWNRSSNINLTNFYRRRLLRLLPALLGLLSFSEVFAILRLHGDYFWSVQKAILATLFYSANWMRVFDISSMGPLPHTWSLSVEEQFYFVWPPLLLILLPRLGRRQILLVLILISSLVGFHRFMLWTGEGSWERIYNGTDTRFDELLVGSAAAFVLAAGWLRNRIVSEVVRYASIPAAVFLGILVPRPMSHRAMSEYGWILIELSAAVILCWLVSNAKSMFHKLLEFPPLVWIGEVSYGLYLWHVPIFSKVGGFHLPYLAKLCLTFTASFVIAAFSHRFIEEPFLRLKSQMTPPAPALVSRPLS